MRDSSMFYFNIAINCPYCTQVTSPHRLEATIRNCSGKIQPYALTDGRPTAEQPQDAPIGRLAFPGLAKGARRGATRRAAKDKSLPRSRRVTICAGLQLHRSEKAPLLPKAQKWATPEKQCYIGLGCASQLGPKNARVPSAEKAWNWSVL